MTPTGGAHPEILQGTRPNLWVRGCEGWQRWLWGDLAKVWIQSLGLEGSQLQVRVAPVLPRPCGGATSRLPAPDSPLLEGGVCLPPPLEFPSSLCGTWSTLRKDVARVTVFLTA